MKLQALGPISISRYTMNMGSIDLLKFITEYFKPDEDGYVNLYGRITILIDPIEPMFLLDGAPVTDQEVTP